MIHEIIKTEYDTTDISIETLCSRNNLTPSELPWYTPDYKKPTNSEDPITSEESHMLEQITDIRSKILQEAKSRLDMSALGEELSTRELKEIEAIATSIETSIKPKVKDEPTTTVNILVQSLMDRTIDDC